MKKVVNPETVAHMWANQTQSEARTSNGSFWFEEKTIYSYGRHFPIAVIDRENPEFVYFTTRTYSVTTAKQIRIVSYAANHKNKIYCKNPDSAARGNHDENIADFEANAKNIARSLKDARKPEKYLLEIANERESMKVYAKHFRLNLKAFPLSFIWIESKDGGMKASEQEKAAKLKAEAERQKKLAKDHAIQLKKFRDYKINRLSTHNGYDYLRLNKETGRIETTQRVEIPQRTAKTLYANILKTIETGKCAVCGTQFMDSYEIKEINKDFIIVGCHKITIKEIKSLAKKLGW